MKTHCTTTQICEDKMWMLDTAMKVSYVMPKFFTQYQLMQKVVVSSNILNNDENHFYNANFDK